MSNTDILRIKLESGLEALGLSLPVPACSRLLEYCDLLIKWNKTVNLTSITEPGQIVSHHLLDSLAIEQYLPDGNVLDVGTGAGLPGIPLAIARPRQKFTLLDSNGKKTRFLVQVVGQLGLKNVNIVNQRAELFQPTERFDVVVSRAFTSVAQFLETCEHLALGGGLFLAMKGKYPADEMSRLPKGFQLVSDKELKVPTLNGERHLLMLRRS